MKDKVLLFINGDAPKSFPDPDKYGLIACTDGAFHYLRKLNFPLEKLDFISGDFDSHSGKEEGIMMKSSSTRLIRTKPIFRKHWRLSKKETSGKLRCSAEAGENRIIFWETSPWLSDIKTGWILDFTTNFQNIILFQKALTYKM